MCRKAQEEAARVPVAERQGEGAAAVQGVAVGAPGRLRHRGRATGACGFATTSLKRSSCFIRTRAIFSFFVFLAHMHAATDFAHDAGGPSRICEHREPAVVPSRCWSRTRTTRSQRATNGWRQGLPFYASFAGNPYHFFLGATDDDNGLAAQPWRNSSNTRTGHLSSAVAVKHRSKQRECVGCCCIAQTACGASGPRWTASSCWPRRSCRVHSRERRSPILACLLILNSLHSAAMRDVGDRGGGGHVQMAL